MNSEIDRVSDIPRCIEARAMLLSHFGRAFVEGDSCLVRNEMPGSRLIVVVSKPSQSILHAALTDRPNAEVLCSVDDLETVGKFLPDYSREHSYLFTPRTERYSSERVDKVRPLTAEDSLEHLPDDLREELNLHLGARVIHTTFEENLAVSFAFSFWQTETLFDISINTAPAHRRRGHARAAVSALIKEQRSLGRTPVWGAVESNVASQRFAESLGFRKVDEVVVFSPS